MVVRPVLCRPFIGRREELTFLERRRRAAASSHGGVVFIAGDAGLGKSRLIAEFCGTLAYSRWRIAEGFCPEFGGRPYGPILDVLARLDVGCDLAAFDSRQEQIDAIVANFAALAARKALLLVVEDVHWADAATLDLLAHLGARAQRMRILILASLRSEDVRPDDPVGAGLAKIGRAARVDRVDLAPLGGVELHAFINEALAGTTLPLETRRTIARVGEGNPFFTEELLKNAVGRHAAGSPTRTGDLLQTLRGTLLERLRPFDTNERRIVAQSAVIGRTFDLDLLAASLATEPAPLLRTLRRARDLQLIEELGPNVFRFRHRLTREAIYADFLDSELGPLHRTVALALEAAPEAERSIEALAYHWWAAGDGERSARYNELAGDAAGRVYAHEDAIAFYERVLEGSDPDPIARGIILEKIAERRFALGWTEAAHATYGDAADAFRTAGSYEREAGNRVHAAVLAYTAGLPAPTAALEAMLTRLDPGEYPARSRVELGLAWLAATFGFPTRAAQHLERVDARALAAAPDVRSRYHNVAAWIAMTVGDLPGFRREHAAWVEAARAGDPIRRLAAAHINGALCFSFFGMHDEALDNIERASAIARDSRNGYVQESASAFAAFTYLMCGDLERARAAVEAVPTTTENHVNFTFGAAWGTVVAAHLGDAPMIEKWFDRFDDAVSRKLEIECGAGFAEILARRGRHDDAAALLHRVIPECELIRGNVLTLLAVGRYGAPHDRERARAYLVRGADGPTELPERAALKLFDAYACARDGRRADAAALAREAAGGFGRLRMPLLEAAALEVAGDVDAALALYRRCGAAYDARRLANERHVEERPSEPSDAGGAVLSRREREIAALAKSGLSNLQIARELAISHKTVEKHLGSAYGKLGISSRRQLRA